MRASGTGERDPERINFLDLCAHFVRSTRVNYIRREQEGVCAGTPRIFAGIKRERARECVVSVSASVWVWVWVCE